MSALAPIRMRWARLPVQQKIWAVLIFLLFPLLGALGVHIYLMNQLLATQQQRHQILLAREQIQVLGRLTVDIEDAFRGYLLSQQPKFLVPMTEAETKLDTALGVALRSLKDQPSIAADLGGIGDRLHKLLLSKRRLIQDLQAGRRTEVLDYVQSGQGLLLSDTLRADFRLLEDRLDQEAIQLDRHAEGLSASAFWGLLVALGGVTALGFQSARLLARSITQPLLELQQSVEQLAAEVEPDDGSLSKARITAAGDEITELAVAYDEMARCLRLYLRELQALDAIGLEINTIRPDGLDGVLRRIAEGAVELVHADVCLVMVRNEQMGCWVVEAASGDWSERLRKSVMLWEEFPVSVRAYETRQPAFGEQLRSDIQPALTRRNVIGESMMAIPLLAQGEAFGVMALVTEQPRAQSHWNVRLALGLAQEAALAISNARLYEASRERQKDLLARLRMLEHLAENLAHDLKGPGERMGELAALLAREHGASLDPRASRWLSLMEANAHELSERVEDILAVAKVGARREPVTAVDLASVVDEVLKAWAGELERKQARVDVKLAVTMLACHKEYLRQLLDNLVSNALKFTSATVPPRLEIVSTVSEDGRACVAVKDNGIGIPAAERERVFEPFVRLDGGRTQGNGIGLTIVQRIVELYGGNVWIEGAPGEGCTVKFIVPVLGSLALGRGQRVDVLTETVGSGSFGTEAGRAGPA